MGGGGTQLFLITARVMSGNFLVQSGLTSKPCPAPDVVIPPPRLGWQKLKAGSSATEGTVWAGTPGLRIPQLVPLRTAAAATAGHKITRRGEWRGQGGCPPGTQEGLSLSAFVPAISSEDPPSEEGQDTPIYTEFDEDFEEPASPIGQCVAIYQFEGEICLRGPHHLLGGQQGGGESLGTFWLNSPPQQGPVRVPSP